MHSDVGLPWTVFLVAGTIGFNALLFATFYCVRCAHKKRQGRVTASQPSPQGAAAERAADDASDDETGHDPDADEIVDERIVDVVQEVSTNEGQGEFPPGGVTVGEDVNVETSPAATRTDQAKRHHGCGTQVYWMSKVDVD